MIRQTPSIAYPKNHYDSLAGLILVKFQSFLSEQAAADPILFDSAKTGDFVRFKLASGIDSKVGIVLALLRSCGRPPRSFAGSLK